MNKAGPRSWGPDVRGGWSAAHTPPPPFKPSHPGIASDKHKDSGLSHNRFCHPNLSLEVIEPFISDTWAILAAADFQHPTPLRLPAYTHIRPMCMLVPPFFCISVSLDLILGNQDLREAKEGERVGLQTKENWVGE